MDRKLHVFWPLGLIAAGTIWLLVSMQKIPAQNLWALTHFWPFLLIGAGLGLILRPFWKYSSLVMDVLLVAGAVLAIVFAAPLGWAEPNLFSMTQSGDFFIGPGQSGSGTMTTETRKVQDFNAIQLDYPAQVFVTQGEKESLKIEAEDNVLPGLKTEVRDHTLDIFYKSADGRHVNPTRLVKITLVVRDLAAMDFNSAGEVTLSGIQTDHLDVSLSGAGNFRMKDLLVKALSVNLSGAGMVTAAGRADDLDLNVSGFGSFNGTELHDKTAEINLSGAGGATVWVDDALNANISGAGSVNYYGSARVTKQIQGLGGVNLIGSK